MAKVVYEGRDYTLDVRDVTVLQLRTIARYGLQAKDLRSLVAVGDVGALRCLFWLMLDQNGGTFLGIDEVNFKPVKFMQALAAVAVASL
jgi:hypothetical protein